MRILLTTDTIGGVWTFTRELTAGLLQQGHHVAMVSFGRSPSGEQQRCCDELSQRYADQFRYESSSVPLEWMQENQSAYSAAESFLLRVADKFSPDIFHTNQFCFGKLPLTLPVVVTAHSDVLSWEQACRSGGLPESDWLRQYRTLVQDGLDNADAVIAPTKWMLHALKQNFSAPNATHVIWNGRTLQKPIVSITRKPQAVTAGRLWDEAKNIALLKTVRSPFRLMLAGDRGNAHSSSSGQIEWLGQLHEDALLDLFCSSSLYIATSIYEPFGLAPLEAALCGCAILANDIPSLREIWGNAALYFRGPGMLEEILAQLHSSPDILRQYQQHALQRALQFSRTRMTRAYLELYRSLLQRRAHFAAMEPAAYA